MLTLMLAASLVGVPGPADGPAYASCAAVPNSFVCVIEVADTRRDPLISDEDRISAGAAATLDLRGSYDHIERLAALAFADQVDPEISSADAQDVLTFIGGYEFSPYQQVVGSSLDILWERALEAPSADGKIAERLVFAADHLRRPDMVPALLHLPNPSGNWTPEARASFANVAIQVAGDWDLASAWMQSGGDHSSQHVVEGLWTEIARARLRQGYDQESARRVLQAFLVKDELSTWVDEDLEALAAGGARDELRQAADALVARGRDPERTLRSRINDLGGAAWALEAAGDHDAAISAAREGVPLTQKLRRHISGADALKWVRSNGAWSIEMLYRLGQRSEALRTGYLGGLQQYQAELDMGGFADPRWLIKDDDWWSIESATSMLLSRRDRAGALALLHSLPPDETKSLQQRLDRAPQRLILAGLARDPAAFDRIWRNTLGALDEADPLGDETGWAGMVASAARSGRTLLMSTDR